MTEIQIAADAIRSAEALLITAGAGMGVDSGLPDFRGPEGFWRAYPPYKKLHLRFEEIANPAWFRDDPELAWGFYGHRLNLYRSTQPHDGFLILRKWAARMANGSFVFTSNVDGHFQRAGFDESQIAECHGSIHHAQCMGECSQAIYPMPSMTVHIDSATMRARPPLPSCSCGDLLRPNILMFGDWNWNPARAEAQHARLLSWLNDVRPVIIECGAGTRIPTVRLFGEQIARETGGYLIRINPFESGSGRTQFQLLTGRASETLQALDHHIEALHGV